MDSHAVKDKERDIWTRVTPGWRKHDAELVKWAEPVTRKMLERAEVRRGARVLDIACGTGRPALPAAELVGPQGWVLGVDFVEDMLAFAREKAAQAGLANVEFRRQDGEELDVPPGSFDAVTVRFGLMFMPEPVECLRRARAALKGGGRIAAATWAGPERNPWASIPLRVLKRHVEVPPPPPGAPGLFAMAEPARLGSVLASAGFKQVSIDEVPVAREYADGRTFLEFILELAGPIASLYGRVPQERRQAVAEEIAAEVEKLRSGGRLLVPGVAWVASAPNS